MKIANRDEALAFMRTMTPTESARWAQRTAEIAEAHNDLGIGMRLALEEIAEARKAQGGAQ